MFALCDVNAFYASCETVFRLIYGVNRWLCYRIMTVALSPETLRQRRWALKWAIPGSNKKICFVAVAWFALAAIMSFTQT